jgi:hypothetical protein
MIRPAFSDERPYILKSWLEAYRHAPGNRNRRWRDYESRVKPILEEILGRDDTRVLVRVVSEGPMDVILGWICFARGVRSADTIHWIQTRYRVGSTGACLRRQGTMTQLVEASELKPFCAYTFPGSLPRSRDEPRVGNDVWIVPWLARHGISARHIPYREWK